MALNPLWLLATSSEFPNGAHVPTVLDPLHLPIQAQSARPWAQAAHTNPLDHL